MDKARKVIKKQNQKNLNGKKEPASCSDSLLEPPLKKGASGTKEKNSGKSDILRIVSFNHEESFQCEEEGTRALFAERPAAVQKRSTQSLNELVSTSWKEHKVLNLSAPEEYGEAEYPSGDIQETAYTVDELNKYGFKLCDEFDGKLVDATKDSFFRNSNDLVATRTSIKICDDRFDEPEEIEDLGYNL